MDDSLVAVFAAFGAVIAVAIVLYIVYVVGLAKMFNKMGEAGWKAIIPLLNTYVVYDRVWKALYFFVVIVIGIVASLLAKGSNEFLHTLGSLCTIAVYIFGIIRNYKLSKAFGHGAGMAIVLTLFPFIGTLILGYGSDTYQPVEEQ